MAEMRAAVFVTVFLLPMFVSSKKCAMFKADNYYAMNVEETYLDAGVFSFDEQSSISLDVLPDAQNYNGVLFAMGNEGFTYRPDWADKEEVKAMQFLVIEILYGAMAVTVKPMNSYRQKNIELYRTYPKIYHLDDAQWHHIELRRVNHTWTLELDEEISVTARVTNSTHNLLLFAKEGYIGGRPDYWDLQYKGLIKNLVVSGREVELAERPVYGLAEVRSCTSRAVRNFIEEIQGQLWGPDAGHQGYPGFQGNRYRRRYR